MRKTLAAAAVAVSLAAVAGFAIDEAGSAGAHPKSANLTIVEHAITDTTTDTGAKGDTAGDVLTFANPVFDRANRHQVGTDNGFCIRTVAGSAYECTWTNTLRGGSIVVTGPFYDDRDSTLAITGGTGKYATVRGQMLLHARDAAGSAYDFIFSTRH